MALVLAWPGALVIGLSLGLLGSGGSILTVPVLVYLAGQEEKLAIASSLAIVGLIAIAAALPYVRDKLVHWRSVVLFGVAVVMLAAAYFMLKPPALERATGKPRAATKITADGLLIGALTGFVGVGGGFLIVPALVLLGGLSMHRAVATSLVIITLKSAAGFYKYLDVLEAERLQVDWMLIGGIAAVGVLGGLLGNQIACRLPQQKLQFGFGILLITMGGFILLRSLPPML